MLNKILRVMGKWATTRRSSVGMLGCLEVLKLVLPNSRVVTV